jgi:murein DD-endopeptidase MepM/ murein hydrolase activator NlpD
MTTMIPLPFGPDERTPGSDGAVVTQGFGGVGWPPGSPPSHQGPLYYAVDFSLGTGVPVLAQGEGKVIAVVENVPTGGWGSNGLGNYVTVEYYGGTENPSTATPWGFYATYQHLEQNRVEVNVGDPITTDEILGYVDNTGYSTAPHLHVGYGNHLFRDWQPDVIADGRPENNNTPPVLFAEEPDGILDAGESYRGGGNDTLQGSLGDDLLNGGSGNDKLYGNDGFDNLYGGSGDDLLDGGPGNDLMIGGPGNDQFTVLAGYDKIWDFNPSEDSLWLPGGRDDQREV